VSEPTAVEAAVRTLLEDSVVDGSTWYDIGPHLTCREVDAFVDFLRAVGDPAAADSLMHGHADEDEPTDSHYNLRCDANTQPQERNTT